MTEVIPVQKFEKKVLIIHKWSLEFFTDAAGYKQWPTYMNSFVDKSLPNVIFYIFGGVKSKTEFTVAVSKFSPKPAKATIVIVVGQEKKIIRIDDWTNSCIFETIPYTIQYGQNYYFSCAIQWEASHDTKFSSVDLHRHIEHYLSEPDFNDLVIKIDDNEIPVHKVILAAYSRVFLAMFKADMAESAKNEIVVKDIEFDIMKLVIEFMYSGKIDSELPVDDLLSILYVGDKYEIMDLKLLCEEILISKMSIYNVFKIFEHANLYRAHDLIKSGIDFMTENKHIVVQSEDFRKLCLSKPELLFDLFTTNIVEHSEHNEFN
ncbi:hypothetical protein PV328_009601 [Microctonus aethiopoides]|uniref:BTB domain-containing protein n=1 Tax=Microctonus aethiopoides TaxID=144406 RepID=A0AA39F0X0_9HYME|nr:hypothetical protein PV328_009601 [Microctonus aethiopoides]